MTSDVEKFFRKHKLHDLMCILRKTIINVLDLITKFLPLYTKMRTVNVCTISHAVCGNVNNLLYLMSFVPTLDAILTHHGMNLFIAKRMRGALDVSR